MFVNIWQHRDRIRTDNGCSLKSYLYAVARNVARDRLRAAKSAPLPVTACDLTVVLSGDTSGYSLDYITLTDGSRLYEIANTALPLYPLTELKRSYDNDGKLISERRYYSLLEGFAVEPGGDAVFVPAAKVASVTIGGVTIPVK